MKNADRQILDQSGWLHWRIQNNVCHDLYEIQIVFLLIWAWSLCELSTGMVYVRKINHIWREDITKFRFWGFLVIIPNLEWESASLFSVQVGSLPCKRQSASDLTWMSLDREELEPATNRREPGFLETSPKPNNFSEFSEAPEECLHFNGKCSECSGSYFGFYFLVERPLLWIRDRTLAKALLRVKEKDLWEIVSVQSLATKPGQRGTRS